jgi:hypothetical protein
LRISVDGPSVWVTGTLTATASPGNHLGIQLASVTLTAGFSWSVKSTGSTDLQKPDESSYNITLEAEIDLDPAPGTDLQAEADVYESGEADVDNPGAIKASISLVSVGTEKFFKLQGWILEVQFSQLMRFFPDEEKGIIQDLLGHLMLKNLTLEYDYSSNSSATSNSNTGSGESPAPGTATRFYLYAAIVIEPIELDLTFYRDSALWIFTAELTTADDVDTDVGTVIKSLMGDTGNSIVAAMPRFVTGIKINKADAGIKFTIESVPAPEPAEGSNDQKGNSSIVTALSIHLPGPEGMDFEVTFAQITEKDKNPTAGTSTASQTKRIVKATMSNLPWHLIPQPPIVDRIAPAFDLLGFSWVQDPMGKPDANQNIGLTYAEVNKINQVLKFPIQYKAPTGTVKPDTVVLTAGWHFNVLDSGGHSQVKSILDYSFNKPQAADNQGGHVEAPSANSGLPENTEEGSGTAKGSLEKNTDTFKISNVGLRYEGGELILFLDVFAHLGPIEFELIGLGFGMNLTQIKLNELTTLVPSFHLQGMAVEFNQPPVAIAGMFVDKSTPDEKMYIGGVALTVEPYQFLAVGAYGQVKKQDGSNGTFKTVFIFAKLNGPLIELEIVTIGGITLGFGYNSTVTHPRIEDVANFPLLSNPNIAQGSGDPLSVMTKLADPGGIVQPQENSYWLAAGLEGKLLQVLDVSAVVIIEFNPYVSLGIYARASASMPPETAPPNPECFCYVELGMMCYVDFHQGQLRVEAQLSPNSFVMDPMCHLSGGFALCYWFGASPYAGDFVFSIGGYHPAYQPPAYYPVPPRLAITWQLSDMLSISGEAYFAITTKVCMGGGMLNAVFNMGLLSAYLTAHADFLMQFDPFYFVAQIGVCIGVEFELELLFISIHISVHLGAQLILHGPPFGGSAYVDFWVFGFTIPFGDDRKDHKPKSVEDFCKMLEKVPDPESKDAAGGSLTWSVLHVLSVEGGSFAEKKTEGETARSAEWQVRSGSFVFRVQSRIPLQSVSEANFDDGEDKSARVDMKTEADFYAKPMHLTQQLISTMEINIKKEVDGVPTTETEFRISGPVLKQMPLSLWGPCEYITTSS